MSRRATSGVIAAILLATTASAALAAATTERESVSSTEAQANDDSLGGSISSNGQQVVFDSFATNLVTPPPQGASQVYLRDRSTGTTTLASVGTNGTPPNSDSYGGLITAGHFVAFNSFASNLVPGDTNDASDVFVHDRTTGKTVRASVGRHGEQGQHESVLAAISANGRFVVFVPSSNLVHVAKLQLMARDLLTNTTTLETVGVDGKPGNDSTSPFASISSDGRWLAFSSRATNLTSKPDKNKFDDVYLRNRVAGTTVLVSVAANGGPANGSSGDAFVSDDGTIVAFDSGARNLVAGKDNNGDSDAFVRDMAAGRTTRISLAAGGKPTNGPTSVAGLSPDGHFVLLISSASNLVAGDNNSKQDVFVYDRVAKTTTLVSVGQSGSQGNGDSGVSGRAFLSSDGHTVAFSSDASNLVSNDTTGKTDVFVRALGGP